MSYYKFTQNDVFHNRIKTHPHVNFKIYTGSVFYNNIDSGAGDHTSILKHVPSGHINLYELNIDRPSDSLIYPFVTKGGSLTSFRTVSTTSFNSDFLYGDIISGTYPLSATISRDYVSDTTRRKVKALKNTLNYYKHLSPSYAYSNSSRNFDSININLISIPSIFYGSNIKKGTVDLKFYVTGTLAAQAQDERRNGELIQTGPVGSPNSGSVVGLVLYNEGFLILTSSVALGPHTEIYPPATSDNPKWIYFATTGSASSSPSSSSFDISFDGTSHISTLTMMAHAKKNELNFSNNPTYISKQSYSDVVTTGSTTKLYREHETLIKNTVKSPYNDPTASFQKQTYISRIGIYDEDKNLIAIAKVATPVRKRETDSYTFKLKLDI